MVPANASPLTVAITSRALFDLEHSHALYRDGVAYMCGNGAMVETCSRLLVDAGLAAEDVRAEKFHAPTTPGPAA